MRIELLVWKRGFYVGIVHGHSYLFRFYEWWSANDEFVFYMVPKNFYEWFLVVMKKHTLQNFDYLTTTVFSYYGIHKFIWNNFSFAFRFLLLKKIWLKNLILTKLKLFMRFWNCKNNQLFTINGFFFLWFEMK